MAYKSMFSTTLSHGKLGLRAKALSEIANECLVYREMDKKGQAWSKKNYPNGYTSYGSLDKIFELSTTFDDLRKKLDTKVQEYAKQLGFKIPAKELKMTSFWINCMGKNAIHTGHIHPLSIISGTLYINVPKKGSPIKFEDPRLGFMMNTPPRESTFQTLQPKSGEFILFESWLRHEVPLNQAKEERISLSFNYDWVRA